MITLQKSFFTFAFGILGLIFGVSGIVCSKVPIDKYQFVTLFRNKDIHVCINIRKWPTICLFTLGMVFMIFFVLALSF